MKWTVRADIGQFDSEIELKLWTLKLAEIRIPNLAVESVLLGKLPVLTFQGSFLQLFLQTRSPHLHVKNMRVDHIEGKRPSPKKLLLVLYAANVGKVAKNHPM
jgi:hypothetical protein